MTDARRKVTRRGEYAGRPLVVGFIVDRDKTSPTHGHFIVYEPHAKVVRRLYARYRALEGRFNLLAAEVASMEYVFPDFEEWVSELDKSALRLKKVPGGYTISRVSLYHLLTAFEYRGWCKYGEWDNKAKKTAFSELLLDSDGKP
jgi:hypothetical protein